MQEWLGYFGGAPLLRVLRSLPFDPICVSKPRNLCHLIIGLSLARGVPTRFPVQCRGRNPEEEWIEPVHPYNVASETARLLWR